MIDFVANEKVFGLSDQDSACYELCCFYDEFMRQFLFWVVMTLSCHAGIIPQPLQTKLIEGHYVLIPGSYIYLPHGKEQVFLPILKESDIDLKMAPADVACAVQFLGNDFLPDRYPAPEGEGYVIRVTKEVINIHAATDAGKFYGLQTLTQLISSSQKSADGTIRIPCQDIIDQPRFAWRGYMLDVSRHFTKPETIKRQLDAMARYKLNRFHWHLTDSPAWRIEIKKYPELTRTGGRGNETDRSKEAPAQFYTQEQIKDIVAYAKERHITVIPEIDMPGHADAAVRSYPQYDGGGYDKWPNFTFHPAKMETLTFLDDVLTEVAALFPEAGVIHFGGDEVHFGWKQWPKLPEVQALMKQENLKDLAAVETWFNRRMAKKINSLGFDTGGWDEIAARDLPTDKTLIFWWRHDKPNILHQAMKDGYPIILCPRRPCYFDFLQHPSHKKGRNWNGINPLSDVYDFPANLKLTESQEKQVRGIQACLWTETTITQNRRDFLTWPRLIALAESAWTDQKNKDFASFRQRLMPEFAWLTKKGIGFYDVDRNSAEVTDGGAKQEYLDNPE